MKKVLVVGLIYGLGVLAVIAFLLDTWGFFTVFGEGKRLAGLIGLSLISAQLLMAARFPLFEKNLGRAKLVKLHRNTGIFALLILLTHAGIDIFGWLANYGMYPFSLPADIARLMGMVALVLFLTAGITAYFWKGLKLSFAAWSRIHLINYFAVPMILIHAFLLGSTIRYQPLATIVWGLSAAIYLCALVYRFVGPRRKTAKKAES